MYKSRLPRIAAELRFVTDGAIRAGAELVAERAKDRVPVSDDPPHLRDDIHVEEIGPSKYAVVAGRTETFYGHIIEHGSVKTAPRPFLVPALEESAAEIVGLVRKVAKTL